jgi:hypothetical protein
MLSMVGSSAVLTSRPTNEEGSTVMRKPRPQSAIVTSQHRKLMQQNVMANRGDFSVRRSYTGSTGSALVAFSEQPPNGGGEGNQDDQGRVMFTGSAAGPGGRSRPLSAMASMRNGTTSNKDKTEIEALKAEILEITKKMLRKEHGSEGRDRRAVKDTENALKGFACTNDPAQMQVAKSALLAMVLQKHEEYQRDALSEFERDVPAEPRPGDADGSAGRVGSARLKKGPQTRFGVLLGLVEAARGVRSDLHRKEKEHSAVRESLAELRLVSTPYPGAASLCPAPHRSACRPVRSGATAGRSCRCAAADGGGGRQEMGKVLEERDLLRAALLEAGRLSTGCKTARPVSAPRLRAPPRQEPVARGPTADDAEGCERCEGLQRQLRESQARLRVVGQQCEEQAEKLRLVEAARAELLLWKQKLPEASSGAAGPPLGGAAGDGAALQDALRKLAEAEKAAAARAAEVRKLQVDAEADRALLEAAAQDAAAKGARVKDLERLLAEERAKGAQLSLNLKATDDSSSGVLDRERELLRQVRPRLRALATNQNTGWPWDLFLPS